MNDAFAAQINDCNKETGETPLHLAASGNHFDCVKVLLEEPSSTLALDAKDAKGPHHMRPDHNASAITEYRRCSASVTSLILAFDSLRRDCAAPRAEQSAL